jgi:hypothetical protein
MATEGSAPKRRYVLRSLGDGTETRAQKLKLFQDGLKQASPEEREALADLYAEKMVRRAKRHS